MKEAQQSDYRIVAFYAYKKAPHSWECGASIRSDRKMSDGFFNYLADVESLDFLFFEVLESVQEHGSAERAGGADGVCAGFYSHFAAFFVDAFAEVFFHPHSARPRRSRSWSCDAWPFRQARCLWQLV